METAIRNLYHLPKGKTFSQQVKLQKSYVDGRTMFRVSWMVHSVRGNLLSTGTTARDTLGEAMGALMEEYEIAVEFA